MRRDAEVPLVAPVDLSSTGLRRWIGQHGVVGVGAADVRGARPDARGVVGHPEHHGLEPVGAGAADGLDVGHARRGLDQDVDADAAGFPPVALLDLVQQGRGELHVGGRAHLRHQHRVEHVPSCLHHVDDVAVAPMGVEPVDPDADRRADQSCAPSASMTFARAASLSSGATASSRSRNTMSAPSVAALPMARSFVPGTASSLRCRRSFFTFVAACRPQRGSTASKAREHPIGGLAVGVHAHEPDPPDRRRGRSEPAADLDVVLTQDPALDLFAVHAVGHVDRRQLPELVIGVGQEA